METRPDLTTLSDQEKDAHILALYALVDELGVIIKRLAEEIDRLKGQLGKNSQNSSKPPSSDGMNKPAPKSLRKPSGQSSGGQKGHRGHHLEAVTNPEHIVHHAVSHCERCAGSLAAAAAAGYEERQVFDIPPPRIEVTAHHLRELVYLLEQHNLVWAGEMIRLLVVMKRCADRAKSRGQSELPANFRELLMQRYDALLEQGFKQDEGLQATEPIPTGPKQRGRKKQSKAKNLLDRLRDYKTEALCFLTDLSVPFDNNQAERDIRMAKVKQKISGTFRSDQGASVFFRIRSYLSSAKKQGHNILDALTLAFQGCPLNVVGAE